MSCKMYLVPEDVINTWRSEQRESAVDKPINTVVNQVDSKMSNILDTDISEYDKEKLFSQELGKYLSMRNQKKTTPSITPQAVTGDVMASIPKMYRNKAAGLLQYLKSDQDVNWDDQGHLYIGQQKIDNSHILDLVHDAMRSRKKVAHPQGWRELSAHLRRKNVPKELVGNPAWFTPSTAPVKGTKRKEFFEPYSYIPTPAKRRVVLTPRKPRQSKIAGREKIKHWTKI